MCYTGLRKQDKKTFYSPSEVNNIVIVHSLPTYVCLFHIFEAEPEVLKEKVKPSATKKGTAYNPL